MPWLTAPPHAKESDPVFRSQHAGARGAPARQAAPRIGFFALTSRLTRDRIAEAGKVVAVVFRAPVSDRAGRLEMVPQRFEKIKSAPENGMVPENSDPIDLVRRATGRRPRVLRVVIGKISGQSGRRGRARPGHPRRSRAPDAIFDRLRQSAYSEMRFFQHGRVDRGPAMTVTEALGKPPRQRVAMEFKFRLTRRKPLKTLFLQATSVWKSFRKTWISFHPAWFSFQPVWFSFRKIWKSFQAAWKTGPPGP